jgi:hypothetical protein
MTMLSARKISVFFIKRKGEKVSFCGTRVDDCLFVCTRDDEWIKQQILMLKNAFRR